MAENRLAGVLLPLAVDSSAWNSGLGRAQKSLNTFAGGLRIAGFRLALVTAPLIAASAAILKFSTDFESAMTGVRKTVNPTVKQFNLLNKGLLEMSKIIPLPATELARITQLAGQFGINTENLLDFTEALAKLSIAAEDLPTEEAARQLARFIELTDAGQKDVTKLASIIARLGDNLATDEGRILNFGVRIAAAGTVTKLAADEILGIAGAFSALVSGVERASTAVQRSFFVMKEASATAGKSLELFSFVAAKSGKITREEFVKVLKEDADKAFIAFVEGIAAIEEAGGNAVALMKQMGLGNLRTAQSFLSAAVGVGTFQKALALASDESKIFSGEVEGTSKLEQEFSNRLQDTTARLTLLRNHIQAAAVILGSSFLPIIKNVITFAIGLTATLEKMAMQFATLPDSTKSTILQFGAWLFIAGPLLIALGTIIATVVALSSVLVPLAAIVGGILGLWRIFTGRSMDLGDVLLLLFEIVVEGIAVIRDFDSGIQFLLADLLRFIKLTSFTKETIAEFVSGGKLVTPALALINQEIAGLELQARSGVGETQNFIDSLAGLRKEAIDLASRIKQGTEGFGTFEEIIDKAAETLEKIKEDLAATAKGAKEAGEKIEGMGNDTEITNEKAKAFEKTLKSLTSRFEELGGIGTATGFAALSTAIVDIFDKVKGKLSKPLEEEITKALQDAIEKNVNNPTILREAIELGEQLGGKVAEGIRDTLFENIERIGPDVLIPVGKGLGDDLVGAILDAGFPKVSTEIGTKIKAPLVEVQDETKKWDNLLRDVADTFRILGISASSTLGRILGGITVAFEAGRNLKKVLFDIADDGTAKFKGFGQALKEDFFGVLIGGFQAIGSLLTATAAGGLEGILGGAAAGAQLGGQLGGILGAVVGGLGGALLGAFRKPEFKRIMEEVGREWGTTISEELAKQIEATAERLDLGKFEAALLNFSAILTEAGGLSAENLGQFTDNFNDLINAVASGSVPAAEGMKALNEGFSAMVEGLEGMGVKGAVEIGKLINKFKELGLEVAAANDLIREKTESAIASLSIFFDFLLEKERLTSAEASAAVTQVAAAFSAALQATGSLFEAFQMLPENFGEIINKLKEILGGENKVLNAISQYYNFTKNNQEILAAIGALGNAFMDLLTIGIITKDNILDFAASFKTSFKELLASTENEKLALISIGPQIGMLLEAFRELGTKPPKWLRDLAGEAEKAGASLIPPEGLPDILKDIRDILASIAEALGAVASEASNATSELNRLGSAGKNIPSGGGGGVPKLRGAQAGLNERIMQPTLLLVAEAGPEDVVVTPSGGMAPPGSGEGDGAPMNVTLVLDGEVLGRFISNASKGGQVRIIPTAIQEF